MNKLLRVSCFAVNLAISGTRRIIQWRSYGVIMHIENILRLLWLNNQKKKEKLYNHTQKMEKTIKLKKKKDIQFEIFVTNNEM